MDVKQRTYAEGKGHALTFKDVKILSWPDGEVVSIEKAGVVLWPAEQYSGPMATEMCLYQYTKVPGDQCLRCGRPWKDHQESTNVVDPPKAGDYMIGGSHYKSPDATGMCPHCRRPVEHWDWSFNLRGLEYAATKYIARWRDKGGLESLKKAIHYVQKIINIHFPGVVVHISYTENGGLWGPTAEQPLQGTDHPGSGTFAGGQGQGGSGLAKGQAAHPEGIPLGPNIRG